MAGHDPRSFQGDAEVLDDLPDNIAIGKAVEAVFAEPILLDEALGQKIRAGAGWDSGVKSPVSSDVLWELGKGFSAGIDDPEDGRMMDGEDGDQGFQPEQKRVVHPCRLEMAGRMDPSMADTIELDAELPELVDDQDGCLPMVIQRGLFAGPVSAMIILNRGGPAPRDTDPVRLPR